jgi:hypothetical protein
MPGSRTHRGDVNAKTPIRIKEQNDIGRRRKERGLSIECRRASNITSTANPRTQFVVLPALFMLPVIAVCLHFYPMFLWSDIVTVAQGQANRSLDCWFLPRVMDDARGPSRARPNFFHALVLAALRRFRFLTPCDLARPFVSCLWH